MAYFVYILYSYSAKRYYIGETENLNLRLEKHNSKFYSKSFTTQAEDWKIYLAIKCKNRIHARKIEQHIKNMKSRQYIENLKKYPEIIDKLIKQY